MSTLILTRASIFYVIQVSDRLVTSAGKTFDPVSNKTIMYLAPDAIVSMSYTGASYLDGIPSDQWLAEVITGYQYDPNARPGTRVGRTPRWLHLGPALQLLQDRLNTAFEGPGVASNLRDQEFEVLVSGWQWSQLDRARPIIARVRKDRGVAKFQLSRAPRHFDRRIMLTGAPEINFNLMEIEQVRMRLGQALSPEEAESTLVDAIRSVAKRTSFVGPNCLSVLLPPPRYSAARVRFLSTKPALLEVASRSGTQVLQAAFSPWVISEGLVHGPSVLAGSMILNLGEFQVTLEAPEAGLGIRAAMGSIRRPPEPKRN